jgi:hypothetical protein
VSRDDAHTWPLSWHLVAERLPERHIPEAIIRRTVQFPHRVRQAPDGTVHYLRAWPTYGGRYLRVVVNPWRRIIVNAFFDRRLGRRQYPREVT